MADIQSSQAGWFIATTEIVDPSLLDAQQFTPENWNQFAVKLYQVLNKIVLLANAKDTGLYDLAEFVTSQQWFPNPSVLNANTSSSPLQLYRQTFRKVINFGALPNATSKAVAHQIDIPDDATLTRLYAAASDINNQIFVPIPYVSTTGDFIQLDMDATNITITTTSDWTAYTRTYVVIELLKN